MFFIKFKKKIQNVIFFLTIAVGIFLFFPQVTKAAVHNFSPGGNNVLADACDSVKTPGDIIHLNAGTYQENKQCNLWVGVSIEGSGMENTIINSTYSATNSSDGSVRLNSASHTNGNQSINNLTLTGSNLVAARGIVINYRNNVIIHNVKIADFYASAIFFRGSKAEWNQVPPQYATGNSIYDSIINNSATRSSTESASVRINGQSGFLLHDNTFSQMKRAKGENGNILGGEWNEALKIYNNSFSKTDDEGGSWNFFFELWHWQGGGEIYNNKFNGGATMDIVDVTKSNYDFGLKIYKNNYLVNTNVKFTPNQIYSIDIEGQNRIEYIYIYENYFKNVPNAIEYNAVVHTEENYNSFDINHIYIFKNVLENVGMTNLSNYPIWIEGYGSNKNISVDQFYIYNNSIQGTNSFKPLTAIQFDIAGKFSNIFVQNNIITNSAKYAVTFDSNLSGSTLSNVTLNNNLYFDNGTNAAIFNMPVDNKVENNNLISDPLFVSATNYNLKVGSAAIDKGINVGLPYSGVALDMGALESGITTVSPVVSVVLPDISTPVSTTGGNSSGGSGSSGQSSKGSYSVPLPAALPVSSPITTSVNKSKDSINKEQAEVSKKFIESEKKLVTKINQNLVTSLAGRLVLQVESHGESWYINPSNKLKYYLGTPELAFSVMRKLGRGITNKNLEKIKIANSLDKNKLVIDKIFSKKQSGKIMLQVESHGEAWYIDPVTNTRYYLGRPKDAYSLMRLLSLGISNTNLRTIGVGELK